MKKYRILPLLLIVCLLLTAAFPAAAAKNTADNSADAPQSTANVSSDGVPQSTVQAQEGSYVFGSVPPQPFKKKLHPKQSISKKASFRFIFSHFRPLELQHLKLKMIFIFAL